MSSRKNDGVAEVVGWIIGLFISAIAATIAYIYDSRKVPPEEKLKKYNKPAYWGIVIRMIPCPICETVNESGSSYCLSCETQLQAFIGNHVDQAPKKETPKIGQIVAIIFLVLVCLAFALYAAEI